jgi:UDP-2,3-diacylglucosamine hydrolase
LKPTLFVSDLHLSPARAALVAAFDALCAGPARDAARLYVLGDLFDAWIGDDQLREPLAGRVAAALRGVADAGVPVAIMKGNRDFLLGQRFAGAAGATLLPDEIVIDLAGTPTLLLHGDELCTDDVGYQRFRRIARNRRWQRGFLALPYPLRARLGDWLRGRSRAATSVKPESIMDVAPGAVEDRFRAAHVTRMIHGHTHRPAHHHLIVDGLPCERRVLADWYERGSYLECGAEGARTRVVPGP